LHIQGKIEMHTEFWWGNLKEKDRLVVVGVGLKVLLKWILHGKVWPELIWFMIRIVGGTC